MVEYVDSHNLICQSTETMLTRELAFLKEEAGSVSRAGIGTKALSAFLRIPSSLTCGLIMKLKFNDLIFS